MYDSDIYEDFIEKMLKKTPYMRAKTLGRAVFNKFNNLSWEHVRSILQTQQDKGNIVLTSDGYALTKGMLVKLVQEFPHFNFGTQYRYGPIAQYSDMMDRDMLACMWFVADMMPYAEHYCVANAPFSLCFDVPADEEKPSRFYQIVNIPADVEDARIEQIRNYALIVPHEDVRNQYRRIAVIENESHSWKVPYLGFSAVCVIDENEKCGFRVVETRTDDVWKDLTDYS